MRIDEEIAIASNVLTETSPVFDAFHKLEIAWTGSWEVARKAPARKTQTNGSSGRE
jgi:hypothetical protein